MPTLEYNCTRTDGVSLVELFVTSERTQRVRIESDLSPVWPPRRQGVPVPGWNGTTFEGVVEAEQPLVVGYATPAEPSEPPARLTGAVTENGEVSPRTLVRALGDATPPRDAVPGGESWTGPRDFDSLAEMGADEPPDGKSGSNSGPDSPAPTGFEWGPDRQTAEPTGTADTHEPTTPPPDATARNSEEEDDVEQRLSALEERLAAIEASVGTGPE
jgi:hypothetical protein